MKMRLFVVLLVAVGLQAALSWAAAAQGPEPHSAAQPHYGPPSPDKVPAWDEMKAGVHAQPASLNPSTGAGPTNAPAVNLGQPGLSFRYVQAFGQTSVPYFEDTSHLNFPIALATDGNNALR